MSQNLDFVRSHLEAEAVKLAGYSEKGQHLRKIRFREALKVITEKKLMFTRAEVEKAWEASVQRLQADGFPQEIPGEVFKRTFFGEVGR